MKRAWIYGSLGLAVSALSISMADGPLLHPRRCEGLPGPRELRALLQDAANGANLSAALGPPGSGVGGLFEGKRMWGSVVNRDGEICATATSTEDPRQVWPGSQQIAKAKAYTANGFSLDIQPLSTASLYLLSQPGHSLYGINASNPFNPDLLAPREGADRRVGGGIITFGGGVPLYNAKGKIIGGLGVSGDTACADHEVAKRARDRAGLNPPDGPTADDIQFVGFDAASLLSHPLCINTLRNGAFIGNEAP